MDRRQQNSPYLDAFLCGNAIKLNELQNMSLKSTQAWSRAESKSFRVAKKQAA